MATKPTDTTTMEKPTAATDPQVGTEQPSNALAVQMGGGALIDYQGEAGVGMEGMTSDDMLVPFIRILQALSPQCDEQNGLEGAKPGLFFNTATNEMFDGRTDGLYFVPCFRDHNFVEYVPRDAGGGFVGLHSVDEPLVAKLQKAQGEFGKLKMENGNELVETRYLYGLAAPRFASENGYTAGDVFQCVIGFASTQIKKAKQINTRLTTVIGTPPKFPMFAHVWLLKSVPEQTKKGKFFGWAAALATEQADKCRLNVASPLYQQARDFHAILKAGAARADFSQTDVDTATGADEEVPF